MGYIVNKGQQKKMLGSQYDVNSQAVLTAVVATTATDNKQTVVEEMLDKKTTLHQRGGRMHSSSKNAQQKSLGQRIPRQWSLACVARTPSLHKEEKWEGEEAAGAR